MQHLVVRTSRTDGLEDQSGFVRNAAGFNVSHVFGYGLLDAYGIVMAAQRWKTVPEKHMCSIEGKPLIIGNSKTPRNNCKRNTPGSPYGKESFGFAHCDNECNGGCCGRTAKDCFQCNNKVASDGVTCVERCAGGFTHDRVNIQNEQCQDISRIIQPRQATHHYIKVAPSDCSANDSLDKRVNFLEHVVFKIHINHHRRGDLEIKLISPQGTKSTLLERRTYDRSTKGFSDWAFMTVHHWGEDPHGTWTLTILDVPQKQRESPRNGLLTQFTLELHGTQKDPQPNWQSIPDPARTSRPLQVNLKQTNRNTEIQERPDSILQHGCRAFNYPKCHQYCAKGGCCGPQASDCRYCAHAVSHDATTCLYQCPFGEYKDSQNKCRSCKHPCTHCVDAERCTHCAKGFVPDGQGTCERQCEPGYFIDETEEVGWNSMKTICRPCFKGCSRCHGMHANQCKNCARGYYLESGFCRQTCKDGFYPEMSDNICRKCAVQCNTCTGPSPNQCLSCKDQDKLKETPNGHKCESECKDLMKPSLCLNVLDFCDVYLVANYCCETCHSQAGSPLKSTRSAGSRLLPFLIKSRRDKP